MRTRSRTIDPTLVKFRQVVSPGPVTWADLAFDEAYGGGIEYIEDSDDQHRREKPCTHSFQVQRVCDTDMVDGNVYQLGVWPSQITTSSNMPIRWALGTILLAGHPMSLVRPSITTIDNLTGLDGKLAYVLERMLPHVNDGLSLVNSILELKDLRRMFNFNVLDKVLYGLKREVPGAKHLDRIFDPSGRLKKTITLKDAAGDYLNYNFGWLPFISDILGLVKALKNLDKRVKYLVARAHRVERKHYILPLEDEWDLPPEHVVTTELTPLFGGIPVYDSSHPSYDSKLTLKPGWVYKPRLHATLEYYYTLPNVSETRRKIRAYMDAFGVRLDPAIIWNAIPLSFVIDWVIDVGGFLRRFTPNDLGMQVVVSDASYSLKYHYLGEATLFYPPSSSYFGRNITKTVLQDERRYYERRTWIPNLFASQARLPTGMQYSLGGALIISRRKTRPTRH